MKTQDILSYLAGRDGKVTTFKHMTDRFKVKSDEMKAALVDAAATTEGFVILSDLATMKSKDQFEFVLPEIFTFEAPVYDNETTDEQDADAEAQISAYEQAQLDAKLDAERAAQDEQGSEDLLDTDGTNSTSNEGEIDLAGEGAECMICGKGLTVEKSLIRGIGPVCWNRLFGYLGGNYTMEELKDPNVVSDAELSSMVDDMVTTQADATKRYATEDEALVDYPEGLISVKDMVTAAKPYGIGVSRVLKQMGGDRGVGEIRNTNWKYVYVGRTRFLSNLALNDLPVIQGEREEKVAAAKAAKVKTPKEPKPKAEPKAKKAKKGGLTIIADPNELAPDVAQEGTIDADGNLTADAE